MLHVVLQEVVTEHDLLEGLYTILPKFLPPLGEVILNLLIESIHTITSVTGTGTHYQLGDNNPLPCSAVECLFLREYICPQLLYISICWLLPGSKSPEKFK